MMTFHAAVMKVQDVRFVVVAVDSMVLQQTEGYRQQKTQQFAAFFPKMPIILMAPDLDGVPVYYGRDDISSYLASISPKAIPWKKYTLA